MCCLFVPEHTGCRGLIHSSESDLPEVFIVLGTRFVDHIFDQVFGQVCGQAFVLFVQFLVRFLTTVFGREHTV